MRYHLQPELSPTYFNLAYHLQQQGWSYTRFPRFAHLKAVHFEFDEKVTQNLEFKHLLSALAQRSCPDIIPETYFIHDNNWSLVLSSIAEKYYTQQYQIHDEIKDIAWILKPALLNNGQHIRIFQRLSDLERHYLSSNRLGGAHVLQRYIKPHLLNDKKYSIRMFVVLTNDRGIYLYPHGYFNEALIPYRADCFTDMRPHLTNEHLHGEIPNVIQKPTAQWDLFAMIYPSIKTQLQQIITALVQTHTDAFQVQKARTLALFGFDFMVDENMRVFLLEANHGPCFPIDRSHPMQTVLYDGFWQALIKHFIKPMTKKHATGEIDQHFFCLHLV